ncbi:MAG: hypothetical protein C0616_08380 [Desulfuromonas sp.]|nr:MAG: hypothetical protein C0616_08380 [Desulfuromonas sp.]
MVEGLIWVVAAFLLYLIALPLVGMALCLLVRVVSPYLCGMALALWMLSANGLTTMELFWSSLLGFVWLAHMLRGRSHLKEMAFHTFHWNEGHYRSMLNTLLGGFPFRRIRRRSLQLRCMSIYPGRLPQ